MTQLDASDAAAPPPSAAEHHLPLTLRQWAQHLRQAGLVEPEERSQLDQLARMLEARFHFETHYQLRNLRYIYDQLDPDLLAGDGPSETTQRVAELTEQFMEQFETILRRANYRHLDREEIEQAASAASDWGVHPQIDLDAFDYLLVYARGAGAFTRNRRKPLRPWQRETVKVPHYARLVVAFSLKPGYQLSDAVRDSAVYLKLFKEIPHADVDTLLPCSKIQMSWFDRTRIALPTISGLGILAYNLYKLTLVGFALILSSFYSFLAFLGIVGGTLGYGVRSFLGYLNTKNKYQLTLTRSLYYQNLDNNAGVLFRLLDEAEQQDLLETLLAYWFVLKAGAGGIDSNTLDRRVEDFLEGAGLGRIDFEVDDAVRKMERLELAQIDPAGKWKAKPVRRALETLDRQWDALFDFHRSSPIPSPSQPTERNDGL